jgi:hypothetical protein
MGKRTYLGTLICLLQNGTAIVNAGRSPAARIDKNAFDMMLGKRHGEARDIEAIPAIRRGASITLGIDTS